MRRIVCVLAFVWGAAGVFAQAAPTAMELLARVDDNEIYGTIVYDGRMIIDYNGKRFEKTMKAWARGNSDSFI